MAAENPGQASDEKDTCNQSCMQVVSALVGFEFEHFAEPRPEHQVEHRDHDGQQKQYGRNAELQPAGEADTGQ